MESDRQTTPRAATTTHGRETTIKKRYTMDSIQDEIIEEFSVFDDWLDKYDYLIGLSETLPAIAPEHRGCGWMRNWRTAGCTTRPTATP